VRWQLEADGHDVVEAADGVAALERLRMCPPALVVLDLSLPAMGGLDLLRAVRRGDVLGCRDVPVIVLSGRSGEADRILGLDLGADDYLVKPFSPRELAARVRSLLRRAGTDVGGALEVGPLTIDVASRAVRRDGTEIALTALEFDLLLFLATHPRQVFSRADLLREVWRADPTYQSDATVTEHVFRLRAKIEDDPSTPTLLRTRRGAGYHLEVR
jgi:two-component system, OmpR family, phosphate regulon response regulator PhoB